LIPTFVIFLREGIEASMIVAILLAYLKRIGQREYFRDVYIGVASAMLFLTLGGFAAYFWVTQYSGSTVQTYFETSTYVLAAGILTYMTYWMQAHARTMSKELERKSELVLSKGSRWGVRILAFQAVGREGLETMVFTLAIVFASSRQAGTPIHGSLLLVGAALGILVALALAYGMYRLGAKLNLRRFFRVMGVLLMVFAAGLLSDAVENIQQLGWLPVGSHVLWNSSGWMAEGSNMGDALHVLLGYAERPTVAQAVVWGVYVVTGIAMFLRMGKKPKAHHSNETPKASAS
jgi:high-affinity iron transporter